MSDSSAPDFLTADVDLLLFGGKGGVGKTTCATATALHRAQTQPVRLLSTDPAHSVQDSLGGESVGEEDARLPERLTIEEIDAHAALASFREAHRATLHEIVSRGTLFDEEDVQRLLDLSLPGMDEVMAFLRLSDAVRDAAPDELLVVDTAPTGHTLRLLDTPDQFRRWVGVLDTMLEKHRYMRSVFAGTREPDALDAFVDRMNERAARVRQLLRDPDRSRFVVVTQAEPLVLAETRRLLDTLRDRSIPAPEGLVNRWERRTVSRSSLRDALTNASAADAPAGPSWWRLPDAEREVRGTTRLARMWEGAEPLAFDAAPDSADDDAPGSRDLPGVPHPIPCPDASLLLVAGKGGVGKTTMASATALHRARRADANRPVLLVSTDPAHSLSAALDTDLSDSPVAVAEGLEAVEIDGAARFERLREAYVAEVRQFFRETGGETVDLTYDRPVAEQLMDLAPPGVDEVMGWTAAMEFLQSNRYDGCVLDPAPTGHFVRLLEMPAVFEEWIRTFFRILRKYRSVLHLPELADRLVRLSKLVKAFRERLNTGDAALLGVTLPADLARAEMEDLKRAADAHGARLNALVVNRLASADASARRRDDETAVLNGYRHAFPDAAIATVTDGRPPQGLRDLRRLADRLYT